MPSKIEKRSTSDLSLSTSIDFNYSIYEESYPTGIATDGVYIYVSDVTTDKIVKFLASDLSYVDDIGSTGSGNDQFNHPGYLIIADPSPIPPVQPISSFGSIIW